MWLPGVRYVSTLAAPPNLAYDLSAMCPFFVRHAPALCQLRSTVCPCLWTLSARGLLWGRAVASCSKFFLSIVQPTRIYCMAAGQFPWHSFWLRNFGLCKLALCLKNCLGSMLVLFSYSNSCEAPHQSWSQAPPCFGQSQAGPADMSSMWPLLSALCVSTMCQLCQLRPCALAAGLCSWPIGAGPWHHEGKKSFSALRNPPRLYCMPAGQFPWHFGSQIRPLQAHPMLEKVFGVYAGIIYSPICAICVGQCHLRSTVTKWEVIQWGHKLATFRPIPTNRIWHEFVYISKSLDVL